MSDSFQVNRCRSIFKTYNLMVIFVSICTNKTAHKFTNENKCGETVHRANGPTFYTTTKTLVSDLDNILVIFSFGFPNARKCLPALSGRRLADARIPWMDSAPTL
jgi:hypothetical protein